LDDARGDPKQDPRRLIRGLRIHRDLDWQYSLWCPLDWQRYDMQDQYGFVYAPGEDLRTGFYIAVQDLSDQLDERITEADLPALYAGMQEGLATLPDCKILHEKEIAKEAAIGFEIMLTFTLEGETCKRLMRLLYNDRQQFTLYGQGVPVYEYEVFRNTFEYIYTTFTFGELPEVVGMPLNPDVAVKWTGQGAGVRAKPLRPRMRPSRSSSKKAEETA
jgi:hypothetical protein